MPEDFLKKQDLLSLDEYDLIGELGEGQYSVVKLYKNKSYDRMLAVKFTNIRPTDDDKLE